MHLELNLGIRLKREKVGYVKFCFVFTLIHFLVKGFKDHFGKLASKLYYLKIINGVKGGAGQQLTANFFSQSELPMKYTQFWDVTLVACRNNPTVRRISEYLSSPKLFSYWNNSTKCLTQKI